jgi:hypothetical protein
MIGPHAMIYVMQMRNNTQLQPLITRNWWALSILYLPFVYKRLSRKNTFQKKGKVKSQNERNKDWLFSWQQLKLLGRRNACSELTPLKVRTVQEHFCKRPKPAYLPQWRPHEHMG